MAEGLIVKVGDVVVCETPDGSWLAKGQRYVVEEILEESIGYGRTVQMLGLNVMPGMLWTSWRFRKPRHDTHGAMDRGQSRPCGNRG